MANSGRKPPPRIVLIAAAIVAVGAILLCGGLCAGLFVGNDDRQRCQDQGGYYKTNGGCDLPYPNRQGGR